MARITRKKRERSHLPREGWSEWKRALVPKDNKRNAIIKRRRNHKGFILENFVKGKNSREMDKNCGIYEWRAIGTKPNQPNHVVYVGSTCPKGSRYGAKLGSRIREYCSNGNHIAEPMNKALGRGYELQVRCKKAKNQEDARKQEAKLLKKYDYAWNKRGNGGRSRRVLPK